VPLANVLVSWSGGWRLVFVMTALMNFLVVGLALFVLRPLRARQLNETPTQKLIEAH
jgi:OFA family oxalate/formate antiporter-like MFS transporter